MARQRAVIAIGEVLLGDDASGSFATGLAADVAIAAVRLGHLGIPVTRLGQDRPATEVTQLLEEAGVDLTHVQSDPDLATGRAIAASATASSRARTRPDEAFDNVQWDYDLPDLAQRTDIVVFGGFATRHGQTRTVVIQFLNECPAALRLLDLTNRSTERLDRAAVASLAQGADVVLVDREALAMLAVASANEVDVEPALTRWQRRHEIGAIVMRTDGPDGAVTLRAAGGSEASTIQCARETVTLAVVAMMLGLRDGEPLADSLERGRRASAQEPDEPVPEGEGAEGRGG